VIEILTAGALSTVQDLGRDGYLRFGVGTAGAMDHLALRLGNLMLGNLEHAAGIEIPVFPFRARFLRDLDFAITGADRDAELDGRPVLPWWTRRARAGQVLTLGGAQAGPGAGARCYLLLAGGVDVPAVLGSRSTQLRGQFGGLQGRALVCGDVLAAGAVEAAAGAADGPTAVHGDAGFGIEPPAMALPAPPSAEVGDAAAGGTTAMRVLPAAEYADFDDPSLQRLWSAEWKIGAQSDRYGYRLAGPALSLKHALETRSHGIVPGVIQVPHSGQPIIQMRDAQPSGGYPKIGTVIEADLWRLGQAPTGSRIRFVPTTYEEALTALDAVQAYVDKVREWVALYRPAGAWNGRALEQTDGNQ
jgi:biotin-dependent carboxylase-like uncharacterized protein